MSVQLAIHAMAKAHPSDRLLRARQLAGLLPRLREISSAFDEWWLPHNRTLREPMPDGADSEWILSRFGTPSKRNPEPFLTVAATSGRKDLEASILLATGMYRSTGVSLATRFVLSMPRLPRREIDAAFDAVVDAFHPDWAAVRPSDVDQSRPAVDGAPWRGPRIFIRGARSARPVFPADASVDVRPFQGGWIVALRDWDPAVAWGQFESDADRLYEWLQSSGLIRPVLDSALDG